MSPSSTDTIIAFATAPMRAGVAVLRVSGTAIPTVLAALGIAKPLPPRMAMLTLLRDGKDGAPIDEALAIYFPAPHSFTGEEVLELHTHGSRAVMTQLITLLTALPAVRLAEAGEFSRRAFINGKMDLVEAEGLADLIDADTEAQAAQALRQMRGSIGAAYEGLRHDVLRLLALLEAYMDFPDEEIPESVLDTVNQSVDAARGQMKKMLADGHKGERLREGIDVVILGAPNAGKSSLLNAIAKRDVAIVSAEAGTTRDIIEVQLNLGGYPVTLIDTAGLREAEGDVEAEGIRRARARAENAELILHIIDIDTISKQSPMNNGLYAEKSLIITSKIDTYTQVDLPANALAVSAKTGQGIDALITTITSIVAKSYDGLDAAFITRTRHRVALEESLSHLSRYDSHAPLELNGEELRRATHALGRITGKVSVDDVLDIVFSTFCIGK